MKTLLVTGGIGSGKSALCRHLSERGIPVYLSDIRAKELYDERPEIVRQLERSFRTSLRTEDGAFDRRKLAGLVFSRASRLARVEKVLYPALLEDFRRWRDSFPKETPLVVMESAVALSKPLFDGLFDAVLLVTADERTRIDRVRERDGLSEDDIRRRLDAQAFDPSRADCILPNDSTLESLFLRADAFLETLL